MILRFIVSSQTKANLVGSVGTSTVLEKARSCLEEYLPSIHARVGFRTTKVTTSDWCWSFFWTHSRMVVTHHGENRVYGVQGCIASGWCLRSKRIATFICSPTIVPSLCDYVHFFELVLSKISSNCNSCIMHNEHYGLLSSLGDPYQLACFGGNNGCIWTRVHAPGVSLWPTLLFNSITY